MWKKKSRTVLICLLVLSASLLVWKTKLLPLGYYWWNMKSGAEQWQSAGLWLPSYRATIEAKAIQAVAQNASGLTFSKSSGTLFSIINSPPEIIELTTEGRLLRRIPIQGAGDPEGITYVKDDLFIFTDEHDQQLYGIRINATTQVVDVRGAPRLGLNIDYQRNLGFEGVSWDSQNQRLFITKEKSPLRVLVVTGLLELFAGKGANLQISEWKSPRANTLFMTDISSLTYHEETGNMLLLSDESALIVEYAMDGTPVSMLPMWPGMQGLKHFVPQAEGIAVGPDGAIYVLSEPNLFYRFERTQKAAWSQ